MERTHAAKVCVCGGGGEVGEMGWHMFVVERQFVFEFVVHVYITCMHVCLCFCRYIALYIFHK